MIKFKMIVMLSLGIIIGMIFYHQFLMSEIQAAPAAPPKGDDVYIYENTTVLRVIDGDTVRVSISVDIGFRITVSRDIGLRLEGIDAPEMNTDEGKEARAALMQILPVGSTVKIETYRDPGAWDRYTAKIYATTSEGVMYSVNDWLVENGHAVYKEYRR